MTARSVSEKPEHAPSRPASPVRTPMIWKERARSAPTRSPFRALLGRAPRALVLSLSKGPRRLVSLALVVSLATVHATPAFAYLKFGVRVDGRQVTLKWNQMPVKYYVTERGAPGVGPSQLQAAVGRAFATWEAVPSASISYQFGGFTAALPLEDDGRSTLGFLDKPELDRVLASTSLLVDGATGALIEADIFFNSEFPWSVASAGEAGRFDLETIALH